MNREEVLRFIQETSWKGSRLGLARMQELMRRLGDPQKMLSFVHVTGTNGKGSCSVMLSTILTAAGYRTGLYTSPHLCTYNERIKINGTDISDEAMGRASEAVRDALQGMKDLPTEFERITAMALWYFAEQQCDIVVLEVGLGGRLDATNIIEAPELAVITNLGLDHTELLGDTIEAIAFEKAGIIKPGCEVLLYQQSEEAEAVVQKKCSTLGCPLTVTDALQEQLLSCNLSGQYLNYRARENVFLRLIGTYQYKNAALVLDAVDVLKHRGWHIPEDAVYQGMASAVWPARFEVLQKKPLIILDGAHNPNGFTELATCLAQYLPGRKMTFVMGVMADKGYEEMLSLIQPFAARLIAVRPEYYRALSSEALAEAAREHLEIPVQDGGTVSNGIALAQSMAKEDDVICICGSLYQAGEARACFNLI